MNKDMENQIGWYGMMAPKTLEEFKMKMAIGQMMVEVTNEFHKQLGRYFDLECSMNKLYEWIMSPEKYKFLIAKETETEMKYAYVSENEPPKELKAVCEKYGVDTIITGLCEDGKHPTFPCNFKEDYLDKTNVDDAWNELQKNRAKNE